ncbi:MAG TPA: hypothetical protein VNK52_10955 [Hyphomicrobiaceae bacterium]|nr:hypothetical protein [Hyphomicrobiaceae bacterium]
MTFAAVRTPLLALAAAAGSIAAVTVTLSRPEALIDQSLRAALRPNAPAGQVRFASPAPEVELLQPSSVREQGGQSRVAQSLAVGSRITITAADGERHTLEVADVRALIDPNRPASAAPGPNLLLVTCKVLGGEAGAMVRFVIEDSGAVPAAFPATVHRAL